MRGVRGYHYSASLILVHIKMTRELIDYKLLFLLPEASECRHLCRPRDCSVSPVGLQCRWAAGHAEKPLLSGLLWKRTI